MPSTAIILHGASPFARGNILEKWAPLLSSGLGLGADILVPELPDPGRPDLATWMGAAHKTLSSCGPGTHLIGHSFGGTIALKLAAELSVLHKVHVVAAPFWAGLDQNWDVPSFALTETEVGQLREKRLFFYHGTEDDIVPFQHLAEFQTTFQEALFRTYEGMNHIDPSEKFLTELATDCLRT